MPHFQIECNTNGREIYDIIADDEEAAKQILYNDAPRPSLTETISFEIETIKEIQ